MTQHKGLHAFRCEPHDGETVKAQKAVSGFRDPGIIRSPCDRFGKHLRHKLRICLTAAVSKNGTHNNLRIFCKCCNLYLLQSVSFAIKKKAPEETVTVPSLQAPLLFLTVFYNTCSYCLHTCLKELSHSHRYGLLY